MMNLDPAQLGQALASALLTLIACVAALRQGLARWSKAQEEAREMERQAQEEVREKERKAQEKERRKEAAARARAMKLAIARPLEDVTERLVKLEHAVDGLLRRRHARTLGGRAAGTKREVPRRGAR